MALGGNGGGPWKGPLKLCQPWSVCVGGGACQGPVLVPLCWGRQWRGSYDLLPACEDLTPGFICRVPPKGRWSLAGPGPRTAQLSLQKARRALAQTLSAYERVRVGSLAHSSFRLPRPNQQV